MSRNETLIDAPPDVVFAVLSDPRRYSQWVVGASRIRTVDGHWPEPGARFGHKIGLWPFLFNDETKVVECEDERRLTLRAEIGAFGAATVELRLEPQGVGRTLVSMTERPSMGPISWVHNPLQDRAFWFRNLISLQLLKRIAEGRAGAPEELSGERE
jgi:carbon monoxide dehydrogenase subunit G